jgi:hypothetical protein
MKQRIDPVIEEIHETRREIAQRFDYDVHRISEDARRRQCLEGRPLWQPKSANQAMHASGDGGRIQNS